MSAESTGFTGESLGSPNDRRGSSATVRAVLRRDAFLGLIKTRQKLQLSFSAYLANRLKIPHAPNVPLLPDIVRARASPT
jgi:hypothetical protein